MGSLQTRLANQLQYAIEISDEKAVLELIKEYPDIVSIPLCEGLTNPMCRAANRNEKGIAMILMKYGANVNSQSSDGRSPLMWAAFLGKFYLPTNSLIHLNSKPWNY